MATMETYAQMLSKILGDFAASRWLRKAAADQITRDPVDSLRDAEMLVELCRQRWREVDARVNSDTHGEDRDCFL